MIIDLYVDCAFEWPLQITIVLSTQNGNKQRKESAFTLADAIGIDGYYELVSSGKGIEGFALPVEVIISVMVKVVQGEINR